MTNHRHAHGLKNPGMNVAGPRAHKYSASGYNCGVMYHVFPTSQVLLYLVGGGLGGWLGDNRESAVGVKSGVAYSSVYFLALSFAFSAG
jgi:hypothetical protein